MNWRVGEWANGEAFTRQITNFPTHQLSLHFFYAKVAELADAPDLGFGTRKGMGVRVPPFAFTLP